MPIMIVQPEIAYFQNAPNHYTPSQGWIFKPKIVEITDNNQIIPFLTSCSCVCGKDYQTWIRELNKKREA